MLVSPLILATLVATSPYTCSHESLFDSSLAKSDELKFKKKLRTRLSTALTDENNERRRQNKKDSNVIRTLAVDPKAKSPDTSINLDIAQDQGSYILVVSVDGIKEPQPHIMGTIEEVAEYAGIHVVELCSRAEQDDKDGINIDLKNDLAAKQSALNRMRRERNQLREKLADVERKLRWVRGSLKASQKRVAELEELVEQLIGEIVSLNEEIDDLKSRISDLEDTIEEKDDLLDVKRQRIAALDLEVLGLEEDVADRDLRIEILSDRNAKLNRSNKNYRANTLNGIYFHAAAAGLTSVAVPLLAISTTSGLKSGEQWLYDGSSSARAEGVFSVQTSINVAVFSGTMILAAFALHGVGVGLMSRGDKSRLRAGLAPGGLQLRF